MGVANVTVKQIAELTGVSRGTVDRVLHNRGGVKPEVARRVRAAAESLGYRPNIVGKALAYQRNPVSIGVVINGVGNPFFDRVLEGIEAARAEVADFGVHIIVKSSKGYQVERQLELIGQLKDQGIAGLCIAPINDDRIAQCLIALNGQGVKTVIFNSDIEDAPRLAFVGCDYEKSGRTAAALLGKFLGGRGRALVVYGSGRMLGHMQRVKGFLDVMAAQYPDIIITGMIENNDDDIVSYERVKEALVQDTPQGCFFAAGGVGGGLRAVADAGLGGRISIVTCDETAEIRDALRKRLIDATIGQEPFQQGYLSVKLLFDAIVSRAEPPNQVIYTRTEIKVLENM